MLKKQVSEVYIVGIGCELGNDFTVRRSNPEHQGRGIHRRAKVGADSTMESTHAPRGAMMLAVESSVGGSEAGAKGLPDENKICQWCCCYCGKSYGSIAYADGYFDMGENSSILTPKLEYFQTAHGAPGEVNGPEGELEGLGLSSFSDVRRAKSLPGPKGSRFGAEDDETLGEADPAEREESHNDGSKVLNHRALLNRTELPHSTPTTPGIVWDAPSRYTCQRCNHMMCPYCPKIRFKDLKV